MSVECSETPRKGSPDSQAVGSATRWSWPACGTLSGVTGAEARLQCTVPWSADGEMEMFSLNCFSSRIDGLPFYLLSALLLMEM